MQHEYTLHLQYATSQPLLFSTQMIYALASVCLSGRVSLLPIPNFRSILHKSWFRYFTNPMKNSFFFLLKFSGWHFKSVCTPFPFFSYLQSFFYRNSFIQHFILFSRVIFFSSCSCLTYRSEFRINCHCVFVYLSFLLPRTIF